MRQLVEGRRHKRVDLVLVGLIQPEVSGRQRGLRCGLEPQRLLQGLANLGCSRSGWLSLRPNTADRDSGIEDALKITAAELERHELQPGERILCRTVNSLRDWAAEPFTPDFVALDVEAARYAASRRIAFLGVDYLSVGPYGGGDGAEIHRALLSAGIWIVEGLNLRDAEPGHYQLVCLPLKIAGADGSPARAILRRDEHSTDT